jgi:hypothetical protein
MIGQIGGVMMPPARMAGIDTSMSDKQNTALSDVLKDYDVESLSDTDAKDIVAQIQELDIIPGADLASALGEAGIDPHELAEQAGIGGGQKRPPPPPGEGGGNHVNTEAVAALTTLLADATDADSGEVDWVNVFSSLAEQGFDLSEPFVDIRL